MLDARTLARGIRGRVIVPGDAEYDAARRVWNGMIDRHPAAIARCTSPEDVAAVVGFAVDAGVPLAVRGGGHNVAGNATCDGGVVIDLSAMKTIEVDREARRGERAAAACGANSTRRPRRSVWPRPAASSRRPGSRASLSVAGSVT